MKNKKAQLHMTETIAVIFIFFILVVFGMIFYAQYQKVAFKEKQEEILSTRAVQTTLRALYLSELENSVVKNIFTISFTPSSVE